MLTMIMWRGITRNATGRCVVILVCKNGVQCGKNGSSRALRRQIDVVQRFANQAFALRHPAAEKMVSVDGVCMALELEKAGVGAVIRCYTHR